MEKLLRLAKLLLIASFLLFITYLSSFKMYCKSEALAELGLLHVPDEADISK